MMEKDDIRAHLPEIRGRYSFDMQLSKITWLRVGGAADVVFMPADIADLAAFLQKLPRHIPVHVVGAGSNLLVRDGGLRGVVIRMGRGLSGIAVNGQEVRAGAGALDATVARRAAAAGVAGLEFLRGIPGTIGGALKMNAGAYRKEIQDVLHEAVVLDREGEQHVIPADKMGFSYRGTRVPEAFIFVEARLQGQADAPVLIETRMAEIMTQRSASQPVKERTGGSTFKNPDPACSGGKSAWQLIDAVGGRGRILGDAQISEQHCNFLINRGHACAADLENLAESVRADVQTKFGVELQWEIRRVGNALRK